MGFPNDNDKYDPEIRSAVERILRTMNGARMTDTVNAILMALQYEHRTIQQRFWGAMLLAQIQYADVDHDLRNEAAVKLAKLVRDVATENNLDYGLPHL